jgi:glutathione S-transferase
LNTNEKYILYGADISYYTGKVRAYLRYKNVPYEERSATRDVYKDVIMPRVGWPVIPVIVTPEGDTLQDTSDMIDALEQRFPQAPVIPTTPRQKVVALMLEVYGDQWLGLPAMHYRWNHNTEWIIGEFGRLTQPDLDEAAQREAGERTCKPFRGSLPFIGVTPDTEAAVETSYEGLLFELDKHFSEHDFLLGSRPSIGDYGLIGPLYAHQYRDPFSGALMQRLAPNVVAWVHRMIDPQPGVGEFLADDQVPETLLPILQRMVDEQLPVIHSTLTEVDHWLTENPEEHEMPRSIGNHSFKIAVGTPEEVTGERMIFPFNQWMWQRPYDCYHALPMTEQEQVGALLEPIGAADAFQTLINQRVERRNFKLMRGSTVGP